MVSYMFRNCGCVPLKMFCTNHQRRPVVMLSEVERFIRQCMKKVGITSSHAERLASNLVAADYRGHYSHGLNRLDMYVKDVSSGTTLSNCEPIIIKENAATAYVDGKNLLGPVVGSFSMKIAIKKAFSSGIGFVVANNSNHFGIAGWYAMQASDEGFIGISLTNTSPLLVPTRGRSRTLGTNPISLSAPAKSGDDFVLDMATTTAAFGKIELHQRKNLPIPKSWGTDANGKECIDPSTVIDDGGLMPLGGCEVTGGYKGYGLSMMVEILCGILADSNYGPNIRSWNNSTSIAKLGQCFIAINPDSFAPGFRDRMADLMDICRSGTAVEPDQQVMVAGDPEKAHMKLCDESGGIPYHPNLISSADGIAERLGVRAMRLL